MNEEFYIYEINNTLGGSGVLIPSDVLVSVFVQAKYKATRQESSNDSFQSLHLADIYGTVRGLVGEEHNVPMQALKSMAMYYPTVFNFSAGLFSSLDCSLFQMR